MTLEERVEVLEREVVALREDYATIAQAPLAQRRMLQALSDTQSEHTRILREHTRVLDEHSRVLDEHSRVLDEHSEALAELKQGMGTIVGMLTTLIDREEAGG